MERSRKKSGGRRKVKEGTARHLRIIGIYVKFQEMTIGGGVGIVAERKKRKDCTCVDFGRQSRT
jgi:hypothetical protein